MLLIRNPLTRHVPLLASLPLALLLLTATSASAQTTTSSKEQNTQHAAYSAEQTAAVNGAAIKTRIAPRRNLQPVAYQPVAGAASKIRVGLRNATDGMIAVPEVQQQIESLGSRAVLSSEVAFAQDLESSTVLFDKNADEVRPIASISKLMTALIIAESGLPMNQMMQITDADVDRMRYSRSRLSVGTELSRADMLHLALMSSENRAAHALGRYYPGGMPAFVRAMNDKARALGMRKTRFVEPTGLSSENVSTPRDLVKLLQATSKQALIQRYTTDDKYKIEVARGRQLVYNNTNRLVGKSDWDIKVSKTGFINEAGECLVMLARIDNRDVAIVLLNSSGRSRIGDAVRLRTVVEKASNVAML